jgi:prevent-host-death family protein
MSIRNVREAKAHFSNLIKRVQASEEIIIARAREPVAKDVAYGDTRR